MSENEADRFALIANGPALFAALVSGLEMGVFARLEDGPASALQLGESVDAPAHQLRVLLHALCSAGLIAREDGIYSLTAASAPLAGERRGDWLTILTAWQSIYYPALLHLTESLREGRNVALDDYLGNEPTLYERLRHAPAVQQAFDQAMSAFTRQSLPALVSQHVFRDVEKVLDIGGGDGTTASALLAAHPHLSVTVFDLAGPQASAAEVDRLSFVAGDLFADVFPAGAGAVLFSHVLEIFDLAEITALLRKAHTVLPPGGKAIVYGFNVNDDETAGAFSARLSLYLNALASGRGFAYPLSDYAHCAREAGFTIETAIAGLPFEHGVLIATKPASV